MQAQLGLVTSPCRISDQYTSFYINLEAGNGLEMSSYQGNLAPDQRGMLEINLLSEM